MNKPRELNGHNKPRYIARISDWLRHHEAHGRLEIVDRAAKWKAKRYRVVKNVSWNRGRC